MNKVLERVLFWTSALIWLFVPSVVSGVLHWDPTVGMFVGLIWGGLGAALIFMPWFFSMRTRA